MKTDLKNRLKYRALATRHRRIDEMISLQQKQRPPDSLTLQALKKRRLEIKDRLYRLQSI